MYVCPRMKKDVYCGSENGWFRVARSFPAVARELCKEIAVSRNTRRLRDSGWCRRRGRALAFPVFAILALKSSDSFFSFFFSSYIYLPIYLDSFLCACAVRVKLRGQRTGVRVRSFHILYFGVESRTSNRRLVDFVRPFWTQIGKFQRRVTSRRLAYTNSRKIRPTASGTTSRLLKSLHD